jgi:large subunit ribosomal protein L29
MKANDLRGMSRDDLNKELVNLRREHFNLRMQRATGQLARPHEYGRVKKDIARVKTILGELDKASKGE